MIELTSQQLAAVSCDGNLLLTACPGSGKTRTLITKLVTVIEELRDSPKAVCCITYTNSAVQEIEQRAREQLQPNDDLYYSVATIHSFCLNEILRPYGWLKAELSGNKKILTRESSDFEAICEYAAAQINFFNLRQTDYEAFESLSVDANGVVIGMAATNEPVCRAAPHFWARCAQLGYLDFGSIIYGSYQLLRDFPFIRSTLCARYRWFLIDEFQDTTALQLEILKLLYSTQKSLFFIVGDIAQSIFSFTGARPELVYPFGEHIGARQDLSLSENFRSSYPIVEHAERLFPRSPAMSAVGSNKDFSVQPMLVRGGSTFQAITEQFLPRLEQANIPLGQATILAKDWASLIVLSRQLRDFGIPVVGPGARPYRRSRLFAQLAEQLCGALVEPTAETTRQLERALFHSILDAAGERRVDVFSHDGRVVLVRLMNEAKRLAAVGQGAVVWLDAMANATGEILNRAELIPESAKGLFYASVQEMKLDMQRQRIDTANLSIDDLGLFANPNRALRLSTIHYSKGREYEAVAIIGLRRGAFPHYRAEDIQAEKRLFYVGVTRAQKLLMYIAESDSFGNPPSMFLGAEGVQLL